MHNDNWTAVGYNLMFGASIMTSLAFLLVSHNNMKDGNKHMKTNIILIRIALCFGFICGAIPIWVDLHQGIADSILSNFYYLMISMSLILFKSAIQRKSKKNLLPPETKRYWGASGFTFLLLVFLET